MLNLVTGAGGFFGSALTRLLVAQGESVRALLLPGFDPGALSGLAVEIVRGDVTDVQSISAAMRGVDRVFHAAGLHSLNAPYANYVNINILGTRNVLQAAAQASVTRFIHVSHASTVGSAPENGLANEDGIWDLGDLHVPYLTSKFLAEREVFQAGARGLDVVCVNPGVMVGENDDAVSFSTRWLIEFLSGNLLAVPPISLNIVDVNDVAKGALQAALRGRRGERYLLTHWNTTAEELFTRVGQLVGRRPPLAVPYEVAFAGSKVSSAVLDLLGIAPNISDSLVRLASKRMLASNAKAVAELDFEVSPIDVTLEKTVRWLNGSGLVKRRL